MTTYIQMRVKEASQYIHILWKPLTNISFTEVSVKANSSVHTQKAKFIGPAWGPPGSCWLQINGWAGIFLISLPCI